MRNLKLTLSYDGTRYQGFSKPQSKEKTAQTTISAKLTETLTRLTEEQVELFCGAKTESGVHALAQVVNFHTACSLSPDELCRSLNHYLPQDICVHSVEEMPERFHAELNVQAETYEYHIINTPVMDVFSRKYALHITKALDIRAMEEAAKALAGRHDFLPFTSGKAKKKRSTMRDLSSIKIMANKIAAGQISDSASEIRICLTANRFLYLMPRLVIGTLIDIGLKNRDIHCIENIFAREEEASLPCAAHGLYLKQISYELPKYQTLH